MEFVTPIINPIVESLMVPVKKHLGFFFSSTKHVTNMNERLQNLNETKHEVEEHKNDALRNDRLIPDRVRGWLERVESVIKEAGTIPNGGNGCLNLKTRYKAGKRSFSILEKINNLLEQQREIKWTDIQRPLGRVISPPGPSTSKTAYDHDIAQNIFPSRKLLFNGVLELLEADNETQMVGLWGMGGVGKTTMMEDIEKAVKKRGMFKWVVRKTIGTKYDPIATQEDIAKHVGEPLKEDNIEERAVRLGNRFEGMSKIGEKILIILDDVWEAIKLKDIGLTSHFPKGFKLLVTSRNERVLTKMNVESKAEVFKMVGIEEAEANSFFWKTVGLSDADGELRKIGENILKKCGGLPIAIKTIAEALKNEEKDAWDLAWEDLKRHNLKDIDNLDGVAYSVFHISYKYLKKDDDKAIFVLCGLFQDDFDISLEELVRYGWGLQLFMRADSLDEARKRTNTSVRNLIRANLLTESSIIGCVKMHDLARAFVLGNISKFKQASIVNHGDKSEWPTQDTWLSCERILLTCKGMPEFPEEFYYPNVLLLKIMNGDRLLELPDGFHERMEKLKVIAYDKMQNPLFLASLQCSISLRTLFLDSCLLVDNNISFLGELLNLEVLSIARCNIRKLTSAIGKLKRLKLLDLTGCVNLCIDDGVLENLKNLEELYMRASEEKPIRFTDPNCDELKVLSEKLIALEFEFFENILQPKNMSFEKLQRFRISIGCSLNVETKYEDKYSFKNTLDLTTNRSDILDCKINVLFSKTGKLHLSVKDMIYVEDIMSASQNSTFSRLKVLHVYNCQELTHLFTIPVANGLKLLESLTVSSCPALKSLVSLSDSHVKVMELPELVKLSLYELPDFTSIIHEYDISDMQPLFNKEVMFPKLSKLTIDDLKELKKLWADDITSGEEDNVSMLREIKVVGCDCLVNLFPRNPMRLLSHLEMIEVKRCCSIEVLFNIDLGKTEQHRNTSSLRRICCENLDKLTEVWRINDENYSGDLICYFKAVETVTIRSCKKFRNVFAPTTVNFDAGSIMEIDIMFDNNDAKDTEITDMAKDEDNMSVVEYPSYHLTHAFHDLRKIRLGGLKGVEVMFEMECPSINREPVTTQQQQPLLPYLQELELHEMDTLSHVWKCNNWNELFILHKHQPQSSFQNLTTIYLYKCNNIKYLFSPLMAKLLSSLKRLDIRDCQGMEEIVLSEVDDIEDAVLNASAYTLFPCLDDIYLSGLDNLKHLGGVLAKRTTDVIHDQFKSGVTPSYAATQMHNVQVLDICRCRSLVGVFGSEAINNINDCTSSNFDQGSLPLPRPNNITTRHDLTNLEGLSISRCDQLEYVFTFSTLESLKNLKVLGIYNCKSLKVIVREENGEKSLSSKVVLPRLKSITLSGLPKLEGFFLGRNVDFEWPSLDYVYMEDCTQMKVFTYGESTAPNLKNVDFEWPSLDYVKMENCTQMMVFTYGESTAPNLKYIHTRLGKYNPECGLNFHQTPASSSSLAPAIAQGAPWSYHNLVQISLKSVNFKKIVPSNELLHLQNLEEVIVKYCRDVEEVFEVTSEVANNESQTVVIVPKLRDMELMNLPRLKYIWKSNQWTRLEFPHLTRLHITQGKCPEIRIFTEGCVVAPELKLVETGIEFFHVGEDINSFIMTKKQEGCVFDDDDDDDDDDDVYGDWVPSDEDE
ncbi:disease resistance protein At4g27190-like [Bidens hawaiensis]|uniref:disease resistance protein At4g27190-like n=1 Tax=Bidens hawaiensis TaxID=980011 RepID=UPI00404B78CA